MKKIIIIVQPKRLLCPSNFSHLSIPCGMEYFPATNDSQWGYIQQLITDCDYYIVILGGRYGSVDDRGISFTQKEYEYAVSLNIPVIGFMHRNIQDLPGNKLEQVPENMDKLKKFRDLVSTRLCKFWTTPSELGGIVSRSMIQEMKRNTRIGWIRADKAASDDANKKIINLLRQIEELNEQLKKYKLETPIGSDLLANNKDLFEIRYYDIDIEEYDGYPKFMEINRTISSLKVEWDQISSYILPKIKEEFFIGGFPKLANKMVTSFLVARGIAEITNISCTKLYKMFSEDSETILIQLEALGFFQEFSRLNTDKKTLRYLRLSPLGLSKLLQLRAIKK